VTVKTSAELLSKNLTRPYEGSGGIARLVNELVLLKTEQQLLSYSGKANTTNSNNSLSEQTLLNEANLYSLSGAFTIN